MELRNSLTESFNPLDISGTREGEAYAAELMRNNVREIVGSYHHTFDHLYECLQNAVDACGKAYHAYKNSGKSAEYVPKLDVVVNLPQNQITVVDSGIGMSTDVVKRFFFTPFATMKNSSEAAQQDTIQRGEKGVGATFLSYGSNLVHLSTLSMESHELTSCRLENGLDWCNQKKDLLPMPAVVPCDPHVELEELSHGTVITIQFSEETNIADLAEHGSTCDHWEAILRLHTAIGYIDFQADDPYLKTMRATVTVIRLDSEIESKVVETGYLYPHQATAANVQLSKLIRDRRGQLPESQRDMNIVWDTFTSAQVGELISNRMQRTSYLRQRTRERISYILNLHKPEAYVAFSYGVDFWEEANRAIWGDQIEGQFRHGIVFATKSQKIGEQSRIDLRFRSGDFNRFFVLLSMRDLKADIGRKSLPEEIGEFAHFFTNAIQNKMVDENDCLKPSPGPFDESLETTLEGLQEEASNRESLRLTLAFSRIPKEEQDVIALFFDLVGAEKIRGYELYSTHISRTYDGIGRFHLKDAEENRYDPVRNRLGVAADKFIDGELRSPNRCFFEFKYSTDGLVKDVRSGYKRLQDVKWLVCWEVGQRHIEEGISILDITEPAQINRRDYYGVTHLMTEGQSKVYVICLKMVIGILAAAET